MNITLRIEPKTMDHRVRCDKQAANAYKKGPNPAKRNIEKIDAEIKRVKAEAERKLAPLYERLDCEIGRCNHSDEKGRVIMEGFTYSVCPLCGYTV